MGSAPNSPFAAQLRTKNSALMPRIRPLNLAARRLRALSTLLTIAISLNSTQLHSQTVPVGSGSYTTTFPGVDAAGRNGYP